MSKQITNSPSLPKDNDRGIKAACPGVLGRFTHRGVDDTGVCVEQRNLIMDLQVKA